MSTDIWFGDSWPIGDELSYSKTPKRFYSKKFTPNATERNRPDLSFACLTTLARSRKYYNYGCGGSSMYFALNQLIKHIKENGIDPGTCAFLCTTDPNRNFTVNNQGEEERFHIRSVNKQHVFKHSPNYSNYETTMTLNNFYGVCAVHGVKAYIVPTWKELEYIKEYSIVPPQNILFKHSLFRETFDVSFSQNLRSHIHPCEQHPNEQSHRQMAQTMIDALR